MAQQIGSVKSLFEKLHSNLAQLALVSFVNNDDQGSNLSEFFNELSGSYQIQIYTVLVSPSAQGLVSYFSVTKVPTNLFIVGFKEVHRTEGSNIPEVLGHIDRITQSFPGLLESIRNENYSKISQFVSSQKVAVFMEDDVKSRRSLKIKRILNGYSYSVFNVLQDPVLAEWLKVYSGSSVFPVLFINGTLQGSIEELIEKIKTGEISSAVGEDLNRRLEKIIGSSKYFIFMMGSKEEPICGYSKRLIALLDSYGIDFDTFDISFDHEVCEGLKKYSNWPTYPQVYVDSQLIGGYDVCTQKHSEGSLKEALKLN